MALHPRDPPGVADRRTVETFGFELLRSCRQMFLAFSNPAIPTEYIQQQFVNPLVERRKDQPFLQISKALIVRSDFDKALE